MDTDSAHCREHGQAATIVVFIASTFTNNSSLYDVYWNVAPQVLAVAAALFPLASHGVALRQVAIIVIVTFWSVRLSCHWWIVWSGFDHEDWRVAVRSCCAVPVGCPAASGCGVGAGLTLAVGGLASAHEAAVVEPACHHGRRPGCHPPHPDAHGVRLLFWHFRGDVWLRTWRGRTPGHAAASPPTVPGCRPRSRTRTTWRGR